MKLTCFIIADGAAEVETLMSSLANAKEQARVSNVAAEKAAADLKEEHATQSQLEVHVSRIEQELKDATRKCELLEEDNKAKAAELPKALQDAQEREVRILSSSRGAPTGRTDSAW